MSLARGQIYLVKPPPGRDPKQARTLVVVSRQTLCDSRADKVVCAPVNSHADGRATEVGVGVDQGLKHESVINCDQLLLIEKARLTHYVGSLSPMLVKAVREAIRIALDVE